MKQILNLSLVATALLSLAWLPLGAASNNTEIARGGGHEGGHGSFEGGEHIQHQQNFDQQHRPYQQQYHPNAQRNFNNEQRRTLDNTERRDWQYQQDRRIDNELENDIVPVAPYYDGIDSTYPDDSSNQQNDGSSQQNDNSDQQNDDANFDSQIWDFNK
ncbi:hypothetical protein [Estrella lausannensis]|uniref:Putative secreted protein n=1 Tax=Estrella lausannensis TaxID=483423 RepID=A0A0H5E5X0_9BACT|nr:hypothetical protein [Estrella lausannensis]CRX38625.1 putative secreted protein [Estrella lausannensis]